MMPEYSTGISQPANGTIRAPGRDGWLERGLLEGRQQARSFSGGTAVSRDCRATPHGSMELTAVDSQLSAISYQLSAIRLLAKAIGSQLSAFS